MAIAVETVAIQYFDIVADTPITGIPIPLYDADEVFVYFGKASETAILNVDYTVDLQGPQFNTFTITPLPSLLTKIDNLIATDPEEINYITVRRELQYLTSITPDLARQTSFMSREIDRLLMRFQQLNERINRALVLSPNFLGNQPRLELKELVPLRSLIVNADGDAIEAGPSSAEIANAEGYAIAAQQAKFDAEGVYNDTVGVRQETSNIRDATETLRQQTSDIRDATDTLRQQTSDIRDAFALLIPNPTGGLASTHFLTPKADGTGYELVEIVLEVPDGSITDAKISSPGIWAEKSRYLAPGDPNERVNRSVIAVLNDYSNSILNYKNGTADPVADGSTDQSSALARALANNKQVFIPPSTAGFAVSGSFLTLTDGQAVVGVEGKSKLVHIGSVDLFRMNGTDIAFKNLLIDSALVTGSAWTFTVDTAAAGADERITLENIVTNSGLNFLRDLNGAGVGVTLRLKDIHCRGHRGTMVELRDFFAFVEWQNLLCDRFGVAGGNVPGFNVFGLEGGFLVNVETTGSMGLAGVTTAQIGMNFENCKALNFLRPMGDNCGGTGLRLRLCEGTQIVSPKTNLCNAAQLLVSGGKDTQIIAPEAHGRRGLAGAAAGIHNIYLEDGTLDVDIVAPNSRYATGAGVFNTNGRRVRVNGGILQENGDVGLRTLDALSYLRAKGVMFAANVGGNYVLAGSSDKLTNCDLNSGAEVSTTAGASSG